MGNVGLSRADGLFRSTMVLAGILQAWLPTPLRELRTATSTSELFCVVLRGLDTPEIEVYYGTTYNAAQQRGGL